MDANTVVAMDDSPVPVEEPEEYLELLGAMRSLIRSEHIAPDDRLAAIDHAVTMAMGGPVAEAKEFADRVTLGLVSLDGDDPLA